MFTVELKTALPPLPVDCIRAGVGDDVDGSSHAIGNHARAVGSARPDARPALFRVTRLVPLRPSVTPWILPVLELVTSALSATMPWPATPEIPPLLLTTTAPAALMPL